MLAVVDHHDLQIRVMPANTVYQTPHGVGPFKCLDDSSQIGNVCFVFSMECIFDPVPEQFASENKIVQGLCEPPESSEGKLLV